MPSLMSRGGGSGSLTGGPVRGYSPSFGGVPSTPSPVGSAAAAISGNIGNLGALYRLGGGINQFNTGEAIAQLARGLPGYPDLVSQSSRNIGQELRGELPSDVIEQIQRQAAERGIATGTVGSQNANAAYLRSLGLNSLQLMQQGESNLTGAVARTPRPPLFDPNRFLVSPEAQQEAQLNENYLAAAPVPSMAAGASRGAAEAGLAAGLGAISAPSRISNPFAPQSATYNPFAPAYNPGVIVGNALYPTEDVAPDEVAKRWNQWNATLPSSVSPATYQILNRPDFSEEFPDYDPYSEESYSYD